MRTLKNNFYPAKEFLALGLFFIFSISNLFSQSYKSIPTVDSLQLTFRKDSTHLYRFQKIRPIVRIDNRDSWTRNKYSTKYIPLYVNGMQFDLIFNEKHNLGICGYTITNSSKEKRLIDNNEIIRYQNLNMGYMTLYYQYVLISKRYFEVDLPFETGLGKYDYHLSDENKIAIPGAQESGFLKLASGGIKTVFKPFKWIGISISTGYRFTFVNPGSDLNLSSVYTSYGLWVDLRRIYRDSRFYFIMRPKYRRQLGRLRWTGK